MSTMLNLEEPSVLNLNFLSSFLGILRETLLKVGSSLLPYGNYCCSGEAIDPAAFCSSKAFFAEGESLGIWKDLTTSLTSCWLSQIKCL
jgi:hypothetical protein